LKNLNKDQTLYLLQTCSTMYFRSKLAQC
jgi:hypothetical protein